MRVASVVAVLALSGGALAQNQLPLPAFDRTFSSATLTRGYWFEAPIDFMITGLRVPDETGHGLQNVEVIRFNGNTPPPSFPGTTNDFQSLARFIGEPSANVLSVNIPVRQGEVIGLLGAAGDGTIMHNSYGPSGSFPSEIFGRPTELTRMGMQFNLATNNAMEIWQEPAGPVSRVEMFYDVIPAPGVLAIGAPAILFATRRRRA
jgi:hypothetical protein